MYQIKKRLRRQEILKCSEKIYPIYVSFLKSIFIQTPFRPRNLTFQLIKNIKNSQTGIITWRPKKVVKKCPNRKFSDGPAVRTLHFQCQGAQVWHLVGELRSHVPFSQKKKKNPNSYYFLNKINGPVQNTNEITNIYLLYLFTLSHTCMIMVATAPVRYNERQSQAVAVHLSLPPVGLK